MSPQTMSVLARSVADNADLALSYWDDGAPRDAARCLRQAADAAERFAEAKDAALAKAIKQ